MKKTINILFVLGLLVVLFGSASSAYAMPDAGKGSGGGNKGKATSTTSAGIAATTPENANLNAVTGELSEEEKADLTFMREEEKLAHDVYTTLYTTWGLDIFNNIAASEQTHTDSINALLSAYGIPDPVTNNAIGVFTNPELQALYNQLIATGSNSLVDALKVGVTIEEIDILDLYEALAHTDEANIERVYNSLLAGSENHLRGFISTLENQTGEIYIPQYLSQASYDAIIGSSSSTQQGAGSQDQGGGSRGGGQGGGRR